MSEHWAEAYYRILNEVERDLPDADMSDQYEEYERRVDVWKGEHGLKTTVSRQESTDRRMVTATDDTRPDSDFDITTARPLGPEPTDSGTT